mmetsp:Transcript_20655/g.44701  ORF Transcript_20655/g.44701 Transcript_20655/m.44701 type:complete len:93 (+) Transcript_20655:456-734(+)
MLMQLMINHNTDDLDGGQWTLALWFKDGSASIYMLALSYTSLPTPDNRNVTTHGTLNTYMHRPFEMLLTLGKNEFGMSSRSDFENYPRLCLL